MSISSVATTSGGGSCYVLQLNLDYKNVKADPIEHLIPVLDGLAVEGKDATGPGVEEVLVELEKERGYPVRRLPIQWRGKTEAEVKSQLFPVAFHYRLQALLVQERTRRRVLENAEMCGFSTIQVRYQFQTPLKYKLFAYWLNNIMSPMAQKAQHSDTSMGASYSSLETGEGVGEEWRAATVEQFERTLSHLLLSTQTPQKESLSSPSLTMNLPQIGGSQSLRDSAS